MPRKPIELPPEVARAFVSDMKAFFACGHDTIKADGIAVGTLHSLRQHGKLKLQRRERDVRADEGRSLKR